MPDLTRAEYMAALRATGRIVNPTVEQMLAVCPHLTQKQVIEGLMDEGGGYIALPPVLIRHSFKTADYYPGNKKEGIAPAFTIGGYCGRTLQSYADGKSRGDVFHNYRFADEAMAYAEAHWPDGLILDDWVDYQTVYVQDPTDQNEYGDPKTKALIHVGLGRDWHKVINDHTKPDWAVWDDAIARATLDPLEGSELMGGRGSYTGYNCAYCGGGLSLSSCHHCGKRFTDNRARSGGSTPLAPKLVKLLRDNGHTFAIDPDRLFQDVPA